MHMPEGGMLRGSLGRPPLTACGKKGDGGGRKRFTERKGNKEGGVSKENEGIVRGGSDSSSRLE